MRAHHCILHPCSLLSYNSLCSCSHSSHPISPLCSACTITPSHSTLSSLHPHSLPIPPHQPYASPPPLIHTIPSTLGVLCPAPIPPLDGEVSWSSNEVGAVLHYYCREGFHLVGTASQECLPIGEWSSYTPLCMKGESAGGATCM